MKKLLALILLGMIGLGSSLAIAAAPSCNSRIEKLHSALKQKDEEIAALQKQIATLKNDLAQPHSLVSLCHSVSDFSAANCSDMASNLNKLSLNGFIITSDCQLETNPDPNSVCYGTRWTTKTQIRYIPENSNFIQSVEDKFDLANSSSQK